MRPIDADAFRAWLLKQKRLSKNNMLMMMDETSTIDAVTVVHGRWRHGSEENYEFSGTICSVCLRHALLDGGESYVESRFCPYCGARMDGEEAQQ